MISSAVSFFILPILTRYLTPSEYGLIAVFNEMQGILTGLMGFSFVGGITVHFYEYSKEELSKYNSNVLILQFTFFSVIFSFFFFFRGWLSKVIVFPENWVYVPCLVAFAVVLKGVNIHLWILEEKAVCTEAHNLSEMVVNVGLTLFLVIVCGLAWQGRLYGMIFANLMFAVISCFILVYIRKYVKFHITKEYIKDVLRMGLPLIPYSMSFWVMGGIDKFFLNSFFGNKVTGLYSVGYTFAMIIHLFQAALGKAWAPFVYRTLKEGEADKKKKIVKFTYLHHVCIFLAAFALAYIAPYALNILVTKEFWGASEYVLWVALGYAAYGMYSMVVPYLFYEKKIALLAKITILAAFVNVIFTYLLIKVNGPIGAAQATFLAFFVCYLLTFRASIKAHKMPWLLT